MIICEIGLNHLGDQDYANQYLESILGSKADAVTFQVIRDSFYEDERFKSLKIEKEFFVGASQRILEAKKEFGAAIDDIDAIDFLEPLGVSFYKVLSKDISNFDLINALMRRTDKHIFISTGMSDFEEIDRFYENVKPAEGRVTLIHTQLAHDIKNVNLKVIKTLNEKYRCPVAFGFHCSNHNVLYLSLAFEPSDVFFYVKGDRGLHPDQEHAIPLKDIQRVVDNLVELPQATGASVKLRMKDWAKGA